MIRNFSNHEFGDLDVVIKDGKEYFEATKIARILGYKNPRQAVSSHCKKEGIIYLDVLTSCNKTKSEINNYKYEETKRVVTKKFIDESNLYRLILRSNLKGAKKFESWVMNDILPSIRKHGIYVEDKVLENIKSDNDYVNKLIEDLILEKERINNLESIIKTQKEYVNIGKMIASTNDSITMGQFAKVLQSNNISIGRNTLYEFLREDGYLIKSGDDRNMPKQIYVNQGLFKVSEKVYNNGKKDILNMKTLITTKGQKHFIDLFNKFKVGVN